MSPDWSPLDTELAIWQRSGLTLPLWWRDDDAIAPTNALGRLTQLSRSLNLPVHLAVIPHDATPALAQFVGAEELLVPVVHGWAHQNHAPVGEKKSEFRLHRPITAIQNDAKSGLVALTELFGKQLCPMFVPPWNRIAPEVVLGWPTLGFHILSTVKPRKAAWAAPGLAQVNTHLDPIDWRGTRRLLPADILIQRTLTLLRDRREGRADNSEPFGILTHHLDHDEEIWSFIQALLSRLLEGSGKAWAAPQRVA